MATEPALLLSNVEKRFAGRAVLHGMSLAIPRGRLFGLIGLNGAGKTTSIRILLGLLEPDGGKAHVLGVPAAQIARLSGRVGVALHGTGVDPQLTCLDNLRAHALRHGRRDVDCAGALARLELSHVERRRASQVSQGERQRLTLARAILLHPEVVVLDEPLTHLDPGAVHRTLEVLREEVTTNGATVLLSSHQLEHVERSVDELALIHDGRVVKQGAVDELLAAAGSTILLVAGPAARATAVLRALPLVEHSEPFADGAERDDGHTRFRVTLREPRSSELNAALVAAGIEVSELSPERRSLDDVFHAITRDGVRP